MLAASVHMVIDARQGAPPAGQNTEFMVCSSGRMIGLLTLAVGA